MLLVAALLLPCWAGAQVRLSGTSITKKTSSAGVPLADEEADTVQNTQPEGIIYDSGDEADSVLRVRVYGFEGTLRDVKLRHIAHPLLDPTGVALHNAAHRMDGDYYMDRGALGQNQLSLLPYSTLTRRLQQAILASALPGLRLQADPYPVYHDLHRLRFFQTQTPYTMLHYGSSANKDYQIGIVHTQNIKPRWNWAFRYDMTSREGVYTNAGGTNHMLDATTNYYSADARYQLQAAITFNRMRQEENGGVQNDTSCWNTSRRAGVPVNMYAAQNQWRDLTVAIHQSFNTVRQFNKAVPIVETRTDTVVEVRQVADTIRPDSVVMRPDTVRSVALRDTIVGYDTLYAHTPRTFNTGVFALDLRYGKQRRIFADSKPDSWFYDNYVLDTTFYLDSTTQRQLSADIYWTNDAYMAHRWRNPFVLQVGIRPEYNVLQFAASQRTLVTVSPFAQALLTIGPLRLRLNAEEVTGGLRGGDYNVASQLHLDLSERSDLNLLLLSEARQPDLIYYHNEGRYAWDYADDQWNKTHRQQLALDYSYTAPDSVGGLLRQLTANGCGMLLGNTIWLDSAMRPTQGDATGLLLQATVSANLRLRWLNLRLQESVQHSSDDAVVRVPLLASKNSLYADLRLFHDALRLQTGFDLRFHTRFMADGWNPLLATYYRQDAVSVGGYLVADFWLAMQVKRASIYLRVNHLNAPLEQSPRYFSLPHYPMEDLGVYWGIIWKFFN